MQVQSGENELRRNRRCVHDAKIRLVEARSSMAKILSESTGGAKETLPPLARLFGLQSENVIKGTPPKIKN